MNVTEAKESLIEETKKLAATCTNDGFKIGKEYVLNSIKGFIEENPSNVYPKEMLLEILNIIEESPDKIIK